MTRLAGNYPSRSRNGKIELKILNQPEEQHRARYLTEGSRGAIKDGSGLGHPVVKLFGFNGCAVKLNCFIGHDKHIGVPHLFYQASRITGKNSTRCSYSKIEGTVVISLDLTPENSMQATIDCIGILKERNVDVEQKVLGLKSSNGIYNNGDAVPFPSKKRCAKCRLIFRCRIPGTNEQLQAVSTPILCTQPVGTPEICKISLKESKVLGGTELYIIGKNFLKDSRVIFKSDNWGKVVEPDKEYLHSSHLICTIPPYDGPNANLPGYFNVSISIRSGGKYSDPHVFTYVNEPNVSVSIPTAIPTAIPAAMPTAIPTVIPSVLPSPIPTPISTPIPTPLSTPTPLTLSASVQVQAPPTIPTPLSAPTPLPVSTAVQVQAPTTGPPPPSHQPSHQNGPTVIEASQISAMTQMSDNELIRIINPSTFEEFKEDYDYILANNIQYMNQC